MNKYDNYHLLEKIITIKPELKILFDIFSLAGYEIRLIGGCIRNLIMDQDIKDFDFAVNCHPKITLDILTKHHIKYKDIGAIYGTIGAIINHQLFEITSLRKDIKCTGRQAEVEFTTDFAIDAERRDFTINALSLDQNDILYDYFNGINDIEKKFIRFINQPHIRIQEDYLRILRFFRFYGEYCKSADHESIIACSDLANRLEQISAERIYSEFQKILICNNNEKMLQLMSEYGILKYLINQDTINNTWLNNLINLEKELNLEKNFLRILTSIINQSNINFIMNRWLKSKKEQNLLQLFINFDYESKIDNIQSLIYKYGYKNSRELMILYCSKHQIIDKSYINIDNIPTPIMPITAADLMKQGYIGAQISKNLKLLENTWINSNFMLNKDDLMHYLKSLDIS